MNEFKLLCPCLLGAEGMVADELRRMGAQGVTPENGRVFFDGGPQMTARANLRLRYGERVQIVLGVFEARTFEELFQNVRALPWEAFIGKNDRFPVKGRSLGSKLHSLPDCQSIIKKAVVERLKSRYRVPWFEETGALCQIQFLIMKDKATVTIDTSGAGLHKRGYRALSAQAPIKETLAAMMADLAHVHSGHTVIDPMCGSGTLLIEAALKAKNIAPGLNRHFAAEEFPFIPEKIWREEREEARALIKTDAPFQAFGYDIDEEALAVARDNAGKAGVADALVLKKRDLRGFSEPFERAAVLCNPPYGERLLDTERARELYRIMGRLFVKKPGWSYTIISPDDEFEQCFGRKADKRRKLYNCMIKCQVYLYFRNGSAGR